MDLSPKKPITVAVSGYFNPIHVGHLDLIEGAKKLGDILVVIVNNDRQVMLKGSAPFMNEEDRVRIVKSIKGVDSVFLSIDKNGSICESLKKIRPDIFAKGGDRDKKDANTKTSTLYPERELCEKLGIKLVFNVGGKKIRSSSIIIAKSASKCSIPIPVSPEE